MDRLWNFMEGLFEPGAPLSPSPGQKKKDKQKHKEEAEHLAREKFLADKDVPLHH